MLEDGDQLWIDCDFRRDRFTAQAIDRLLERWHALLRAMLADPGAAVARLPVMDGAELATLARWSHGSPAGAGFTGVDQRIAAQVARAPDAVAITAGAQVVTYRELGERAGRLADQLSDLGVGPEVLVGVFLERSPEQVVAVLGVMEAGGAFVPLDVKHPERRLATLMDEAGVRLVVTRPALRHLLPPGTEAVLIDEPGPAGEARPRRAPRRPVAPADLAYVIFTSGSTGRPKGVEIEHGSLATYLDWAARHCLGHGGRGMPLSGALTFDVTLVGLLLPLIAGQTVDIISEQQGLGGLARALVDRPVPYAALALTPTHLRLLDSLVPEGATTPAPGLVVVAGEALDGRLTRRWQQRWPGAILLNQYGPTEATVVCTAYRVPADQPDGPVPIGQPIDGASLFVLDAALEPAPVGAIGELYIGGPCLARGYRRDPARTAERFLDGPRGRLYRTGDLAYWRADGELVFAGRVDHQLKIRGVRIEPGEIEAALSQHPMVAQYVVGPWRDAHDEQRLVAWIVPRAGAALDAAALREHLGAQLPAQLVPSYFVAIERVPLTAGGKIDRGSLPAPVAAPSPAARPGEAPDEDRVRRMLSIWSRILGDPALTADDRFIDRGGDSLLAVRLAAEISRELGVTIDAGDVYRYPSARLMVRALAGGRSAAADAGRTLVLRPGVAQPPLFLFHPVGGHVLCYGGLCRALGGERPVIGVRARGSEPGESPLADITAMARLYLDDVRGLQPRGPYLLAGWSMGGLIAFEAARLLRAEGEPVALLAMIDSELASAREIDAAAAGPGAWAHVLATLTSVPPERIDVPADLPLQPDARALGDLWKRLASTGVAALLPTVGDFERFVRMFHAHAEAMRRYVPGPVDVGHAVYFAPRHGTDGQGGERFERWREHLPRLQLVEVPGDHFTVVRADVAVVASRLARAIDAALGPARALRG